MAANGIRLKSFIILNNIPCFYLEVAFNFITGLNLTQGRYFPSIVETAGKGLPLTLKIFRRHFIRLLLVETAM